MSERALIADLLARVVILRELLAVGDVDAVDAILADLEHDLAGPHGEKDCE